MEDRTPSQIVKELDKYIIGQDKAKKAVAISLRNRYRRRLLSEDIRSEIKPRNILMIGPTGVGKTEIARRLAMLVDIPFVKVEATKFTEVGYVGRDVDSMVRDLVEESIRMVKAKKLTEVYEKSRLLADEKILNILLPTSKKRSHNPFELIFANEKEIEEVDEEERESIANRRKELMEMLKNGELDDQVIEVEVEDNHNSTIGLFGGLGLEELNINLGDIFGDMLPKKLKKKKLTIKEARKVLSNQESEKLIDMEEVVELGIKKAEEDGIIFIDEIDKIAGKNYTSGPDVSREGVQRDILPIVEGTTVMTKYGPIKTDYILFIAAGAFHVSKVEDLIPELQGRFPIRVELDNLTENDFINILTKPQNALIKQYQHLMKTEGVDLQFTDESINMIAKVAFLINEQSENIGARRLSTVMEKLLEDVSFEVPDLNADNKIIIDEDYVKERLGSYVQQKDITKYIL
ncbi:MAG: ATP-dependent protease ATPase subunit HslU [Tissierellia bacterium]|nr:ATP-dependent protease ATPase subunit HslU [Tissierellia bacterium]